METPQELSLCIAAAEKTKRLSFNLSRKTLSERSGVSESVIKKFEHRGEISLLSLLKLAHALDSTLEFKELFKEPSPDKLASLDELFKEKSRKRGRK